MPLDVKLKEKVSDSVYRAVGEFSGEQTGGEPFHEDAEVLVEKIDEHQVQLIIDDSLHPTTIGGNRIVEYYHAEPVEVNIIRKGVNVSFSKFYAKPENT